MYSSLDNIDIKKFWSPSFGTSKKENIEVYNLENILKDAVISTFQSDHNLGVFLSGGLDSGSIITFLTKASYNPETFTIGYDCGKYEDENEEAIKLASNFNVKHRTLKLESHCIEEAIRQTISFIDEPIYSTVAVSTYWLSKYASQYVKDILTGDGSDELFLSYEYLIRIASSARNKSVDLKALYLEEIGWLNKNWKNNLLDPYLIELTNYNDIFSQHVTDTSIFLNDIRNFEISRRLPEYHLARIDRLTMAHGIEARVPFLRKKVIEWALSKTTGNLLYEN